MTTHARVSAEFAAQPIWTEVSMREYDVLYTLTKLDGPTRLQDLQREVLLSQPALSRMVDRLVARGLLIREADPGDGRAVLVQLSEDGKRVQRDVGRAHGRDVGSAMQALDSDEQRELLRLTQKLLTAQTGTP